MSYYLVPHFISTPCTFQIEGIDGEEEVERIMGEFYRSYLLSNKDNFNSYTTQWRKYNIRLVYLSARAQGSRVVRTVRNSVSRPKS